MILDIIIVLVVALAGFLGYKKGLVTMLISLVGVILAIVLAITLQEPVATYFMDKTGLGNTVNSQIEETLKNAINSKVEQKNEEITNEEQIDTENREEAKKENKNSSFISNFITEDLVEENISTISKNVTTFIFKGISFIGIFIITIIIVYIIRMILNLVCELPILNSLNKIGGVAIGILKGSLVVFIVLAIVSLLEPMGITTSIVNYMKTSVVTSFLYENNVIVDLIKGNLKF